MADTEVLSTAKQNIIDLCTISLGYPVVSLYITTAQISVLIDFAVRKCTSKACPTFISTLYTASGVMDVSSLGIDTIKNVYQSDLGGVSCSMASGGCDICDKLCNYRWYSEMVKGDWNNQMYDRLAYQYARAEIQKEIMYDWYLDGTSLYLDNYTGYVTLEYLKKVITLEDLDSYWSTWVESYVLALVKITEGRIRSKYKLSSGTFEIESDELISEGNTDKQELEDKLNDSLGYWNIIR